MHFLRTLLTVSDTFFGIEKTKTNVTSVVSKNEHDKKSTVTDDGADGAG
jgi:hypothetical protein